MTVTKPDELLDRFTSTYRHARQELQRTGEEGTGRRKRAAQLEELQRKFETTLTRWVEGDELREAWRRHFYHDEARPEDEPLPNPPQFVGESESGARVEVTIETGDLILAVDGSVADRIPAPPPEEFDDQPRVTLQRLFGEQKVVEKFEAPKPALTALAEYGDDGDAQPPWEHSRSLYTDGLVDVNFSFTGRGRRFLRARRRQG